MITCNYDGKDKHRTVVEDDAFIGCDTMLVAPVTVGEGIHNRRGGRWSPRTSLPLDWQWGCLLL